MDYARIEKEARKLQLELWTRAELKYPIGRPPVLQVFDPGAAAELAGYAYGTRPYLGNGLPGQGVRFETAGLIDHEHRIILVSDRLPYEVQRFTAAHEIGHMALHPGLRLHRDRPLSGAGAPKGARPLIEREADYFAACFLAPAKLVYKAFTQRFGEPPQALTHTFAYHLLGQGAHELLSARTGSLDFEVALARATRFGNRGFRSLAQEFGLSTHAMALRLRELKLACY